MGDFWRMVIATFISRAIFSLLFNILNQNIYGIFVPMQRDLAKLSNTNRCILYFAGNALSVAITILIGVRVDISGVLAGIILGFGSAIVDTCLGNAIKENSTQRNQ